VDNDKAKAAFVDRDGTLIEEKDFLTEEEDIKIFPHSAEAIRLLRELGYLVVVVSNQSGVARGYLTEQRVFEINEEVFSQLEEKDARPDLFFYCPHHPDATIEEYRSECECRKPRPGMVKMAQQIIDIDIARSVSIGDKLSDVQLCRNLGGRGILVLTGYGAAERDRIESSGIEPDFVADSVLDAARWLEKSPAGG
jgi:D-glycero-D-manno-heptose 1,7-bisphosphate phosphatase